MPEIGRAVFRDGQLARDVTDFYLPGFIAAGSPSPGSAGWDAFTGQFLDELNAGGNATGGWGIAGAFYVAKDFVTSDDMSNSRFVALVDSALRFMADADVPTASIPMFALGRWHALHRET